MPLDCSGVPVHRHFQGQGVVRRRHCCPPPPLTMAPTSSRGGLVRNGERRLRRRSHRCPPSPLIEGSGDTTPCKVTPVILHGVISPDGVVFISRWGYNPMRALERALKRARVLLSLARSLFVPISFSLSLSVPPSLSLSLPVSLYRWRLFSRPAGAFPASAPKNLHNNV